MITNEHCSLQNSCDLETGLSDLRTMAVTILMTHFKKHDLKLINYHDYKSFSNENYRQTIFDECPNMQRSYESWSLDNCFNVCKRAVDICAPRKKRYLRANNSPFIDKITSKTIMDRTSFRNKSLRIRILKNKLAYNEQRRDCYNNFDQKTITGSKLLTNTIKLFFSDKGARSRKITLIKENEIINSDEEISLMFK